MLRIILKTSLTALVIVGVSELGKKVSWMAAILAALPLTSILAMIWLYWDTRDPGAISQLSNEILWAVLPSLLFFWVLPKLLQWGLSFPVAMPLACFVMILGYSAYLFVLNRAKLHL